MKKVIVLLIVSLMLVVCGNVWGKTNTVTVIDTTEVPKLGTHSVSIICMEGLLFVSSFGHDSRVQGRGSIGIGVSTSIIQVMDKNGKPKTCKN